MEKVLGIGGVFFRARDPEGLAQWYADHLGIDPVPDDPSAQPWIAAGGPTVFAPFQRDTDYFPPQKQFMLNFRVRDIDAMVAQLEGAGIAIRWHEDMPGIGRFAHLDDPEGNVIELWEPDQD